MAVCEEVGILPKATKYNRWTERRVGGMAATVWPLHHIGNAVLSVWRSIIYYHIYWVMGYVLDVVNV
jgi:hypothetical protein